VTAADTLLRDASGRIVVTNLRWFVEHALSSSNATPTKAQAREIELATIQDWMLEDPERVVEAIFFTPT
jgi:hypothetical protein